MHFWRLFSLGVYGLIALAFASVASAFTRFPEHAASGVNPDTHLQLTFPTPPSLGTAGCIRIYDANDDRLVDTLDLSIPPGPTEPNRVRAPYTEVPYLYIPTHRTNANTRPGTPSGTALPTPDTYQLTIIGGFTDGFHFYPVIIRGNTATIYLHHNLLDYGKRYYVQIDPDVLTTADGAFPGFAGKDAWTFATKPAGPPPGTRRIVVDADGLGDFNTVQGAIDAVPDFNPERVTIYVRNGRYEEIVYFRHKANLTILGESREHVRICYANNEVFNPHPANVRTNEWPGTFPSRRAAFTVDASSGIHLVNLTIESINPQPAQAEGLLIVGERHVVKDVTIIGSGDALQANGSVYLENTRITGIGDNVLGRGPCYFKGCELITTGGPHMWIRNTRANRGNVFVDCTFRTLGDGQALIARRAPEHTHAEAVLLDCRLQGVAPEGWGSPEDVAPDVHYWEFHSTNLDDGQPVDTSARHPVSRQLTLPDDAELIRHYRDPAWVLGGWVPDLRYLEE